jgi:hypothetical protein
MMPLKNHSWSRTLSTLCFYSILCSLLLGHADGAEQRRLYLFRAPEPKEGYKTAKPSIEIYDMDNGHRLLKTVSLVVPSGTRPVGDIRGVNISAKTRKIFISHYGATATDNRHSPGWLTCVDLVTEKVLWNKVLGTTQYPSASIDRGAMSPDGLTLYMPDGESSGKPYWHVLDAATGTHKYPYTVTHIRSAHNTVCNLDGSRVFMQGFGKPTSGISSSVGGRDVTNRSLMVYFPKTNTKKLVGPFKEVNRPFTINGKGTLAFMTVNDFIGFQTANVDTGKVLFTSGIPTGTYTGKKYDGKTATLTFSQPTDGTGTRCHGIAMTGNEKFIYHVDQQRASVHIWDVSGLPSTAPKYVTFIRLHSGTESDSSGKRLYGETGIVGQPGWISSSYDGRYLYPETCEVIDTTTHTVVGQLKGASGNYALSRFAVEVVWDNGVPVRAGDQFGIGRIGTTTSVGIPSAPTGLAASTVSTSQINLTWADNSTVEDGYRIERSPDGINFTQIASVGASVKAYSNTGLTSNTQYHYRVRAYNASGNSSYSNVASAKTGAKPAAPTNLAVSSVSTTELGLSWADNSSVESGYIIEQSSDGTTFSQIAQAGANATTYTRSGLTAGTTYHFRVKAFNNYAQSAYTNVASGTTQAATNVITRLVLVDAGTDLDIAGMNDGMVILLSSITSRKINVRAETNPSRVGSVRFVLSGTQSRTHTENSAPYALFSNSGSAYHAWTPATGLYTLKVNSFTEMNGGGTAGPVVTFNFEVK